MLGQKTVNALLTLKPSGPRSFEDLLRELLSELTEQPYHLSSSGRQGGVDGVSATGSIGFEAKRYGETDLDIPGLQGQLGRVRRTRPEIELWLLVTTGRLAAQDRQELENAAADNGIALLILAEEDLPVAFHPMAGLCATQPERVCEILADLAWRDPKKEATFALDEVRAELEEIAAFPEFASFRARLEKEVRELPTWRIFVQRQNQRLKRAILEDSKIRLGTHFDRDKVIPRTIKAEFDQWLTAAMSSHEPHLGAVLGERFDGKTWMVLDWLVDQLESMDVPVFFLGSNRGDVLETLNEMLIKEAEAVLGAYGRHARALLERRRLWSAGRTPWCLLILDGLNEYRNPSHPWQRHLSDAFARVEVEYRPSAVLCTVRTKTWTEIDEEVKRPVKGQVRTFVVGPFDEAEFSEALRRAGKAHEEINAIPQSAQELLRRPRFLQLVLEHRDRLGDFEVINEDVLYWLDTSDKLRRERAAAAWSEERYQGVLVEFAKKAMARHPLTRKDVLDSLQTQIRSEFEAAFNDLVSEGVLDKKRSKYSVCREHLVTGMALYLLDLLDDPSTEQQELRERLRDALSPYGEDDIVAVWLRRASVFALLSEEPPRDVVIDTLVDGWLRSRNRPFDDFQQQRSLSRLLLPPLLRLAPRTWARTTEHRGLKELSILIFSRYLGSEKSLIQQFARAWCRLVPARGPQFVEDKPDSKQAVSAALQEEGLRRLGLCAQDDSGLLALQKFVLYLESLSPGLTGPDDLLAILAAHHIPRKSFAGAGPWILRKALRDVPREWFDDWAQLGSRDGSPVLKQTIYDLLGLVERADLKHLRALVKPQVGDEQRFTFDRNYYEAILSKPFAADEDPMLFLRRVRPLVIDPGLSPLRGERLKVVRKAWRGAFAGILLQLGNAPTVEDHLFDETVAGVSAWIPEEGAAVVGRQIDDLARRFSEDHQYWWAHSMRRHAVLVTGKARGKVQAAIEVASNNSDTTDAQGDLLEALLPGMSPSACVDAILSHPLDFEWDGFYYLAACLDRERLVQACLSTLNREHTPRARARLYTLLGSLQAFPQSKEQIQTLLHDLSSNDHDLSFGALIPGSVADPLILPEEVRKDARHVRQIIDSKKYLRPARQIVKNIQAMLEPWVLEARTDLQLLEVALTARYQGEAHILVVIDKLLKNCDPEVRARAARLLGWLEGSEERLRGLMEADTSLWVRRIANQSLRLRTQEGFARYWLDRFMRRDLTREQRWGAGQLFLEVADGCCDAWGGDRVMEGAPNPRIRGEAVLLLKEAEWLFRNFGSGTLKKTFLGMQVVDLESGCHPWRRQRSWHELEQHF